MSKNNKVPELVLEVKKTQGTRICFRAQKRNNDTRISDRDQKETLRQNELQRSMRNKLPELVSAVKKNMVSELVSEVKKKQGTSISYRGRKETRYHN